MRARRGKTCLQVHAGGIRNLGAVITIAPVIECDLVVLHCGTWLGQFIGGPPSRAARSGQVKLPESG